MIILCAEADARLGRFGWWIEEGLELRPDDAQGVIVFEERFIHFGETFENGGVGHELLALLHEGAHNIDAHLDGARAMQDVGGHERAMFGKGPGAVCRATATFRIKRKFAFRK